MIEPEDFGLSPVQTFAHVSDPLPAVDHSVFWTHWYSSLIECTPSLRIRTEADESDPTATHEIICDDGVRLGCTLVTPSNARPVRASLVVVHGYSTPKKLKVEANRWQRVADNGVAVLVIRLRGFPGSQIGIGDQLGLDELGAGWIGRGFDGSNHEDWILPKAITDVCNACRVMRNLLLNRDVDESTKGSFEVEPQISHPGVYLTGRSLGGGIATIAAAQLIGKLSGEPIIDRLAISLPSLGAWDWKLSHRHSGTTIEINKILTHHSDRRDELTSRLKLCDAVTHAKKVRVPTLAMLARLDDVSPAPSAAAIYNAIDSDPGRKWRFVVPYGHFEGGIANARRHALFERTMVDFFDPARLPIQSMHDWEPMLHAGETGPDGRAGQITPDIDDQDPEQ